MAAFWYQILLSPICSCINFQVWFYFTWPHLFLHRRCFCMSMHIRKPRWSLNSINCKRYVLTFTQPIILFLNKEQQQKELHVCRVHSSTDATHRYQKIHFDTSYLFISRINLHHDKHYWCLYMCIAARNAKKLQAGYLVTNGTRTTCYSIHFDTNASVLAPFLTFYDAKPQLVKTPVDGKPSTISPNHTCQCSLLILSYNINPSHFSTT